MNPDPNAPNAERPLADALRADGPALDPNELAALAGGTLSEADRARLIERLADAPDEDLALAVDVADAAPAVATTGADRREGSWWLPLAVAAMLLVAIGAWWQASQGARDPDERLAAAFASVARADPAAFEGLAPLLGPERRAAPVRPVLRGGIQVLAPRGGVLGDPATIRIAPIEGATRYEIRILSDDGLDVSHVADTSEVPWPHDATTRAGGRYVVSVVALAAAVRVRGSAAFHRLGTAEAALHERALAAIDAQAPARLRPILRAQVAIRHGLLGEAAAHLADAGDEPIARELRAYLAARGP